MSCHVNNRGFTLWELMVVVSLVVFLFATAVERLLPLRAHAERAAVYQVVGTLRGAVGMETSQRVLEDGFASLDAMRGMNPMDTLAVMPGNYVGEKSSYASVERGTWAYVPDQSALFYRVRYPEYFAGSFMDPAGIRFRVQVSSDDSGRVTGVSLEQLDSAQWNVDRSELLRMMEHQEP